MLTADGCVAEGSLLAIGWFEGDVVRAPALELGILPSIGRARALQVALELGMEVEEGCFGLAEMEGRAAWITTAVRGVVPIALLDGDPVPTDPGTDLLARHFWPG